MVGKHTASPREPKAGISRRDSGRGVPVLRWRIAWLAIWCTAFCSASVTSPRMSFACESPCWLHTSRGSRIWTREASGQGQSACCFCTTPSSLCRHLAHARQVRHAAQQSDQAAGFALETGPTPTSYVRARARRPTGAGRWVSQHRLTTWEAQWSAAGFCTPRASRVR